MGRYARDNNDAFRPAPVRRINLDVKNVKMRIVMFCFFLALAVVAFYYFGVTAMSTDPGWTEIVPDTLKGGSVASEFTFYYNLGQGTQSATKEKKALTQLYQSAAMEAYQIFNAYEDFPNCSNLYTLSQNPNTTVTVAPALYKALEQLNAAGDRRVFLAPVYGDYYNLAHSEFDFYAAEYDPYSSPETAQRILETCRFINDPEQIRLDLLGNNQVCLTVSPAYLAYAQEQEFPRLLDLHWMENAFVADYLAEELTEKGYELGVLSSDDGFCRVLDPTEARYSTDVLDWAGEGAFKACSVQLSGPVATLSLHTYDVFDAEEQRYYRYEDGTLRFPYVDPADGLCKAALNDLVVYGQNQTCADLVLTAAPVYIRDHFDPADLAAFARSGMETVYCLNQQILHSQESLECTDIFNSAGISYTPKHQPNG